MYSAGAAARNSVSKVWMLVHKEERPDLYRGVMSGELNETVCSHCGSVFVLEIPVLVIEPDIYPPITFYPGLTQSQ
ncbi:MAG: CpXC domain-containing protein [Candidatus Thiodiazotropha sp. (ex. Lucinoma kazani)]